MSYPASLIAFAFVKKGIDEGNPVTQMKLQKMVYFAHGMHLALDRGALIKETFQAWKFGPVVPEIYQDYKIYGSGPITTTDLLRIFSTGQICDNEDLKKIDKKAQESVDDAWSVLKELDALSLSAWTHKDGSPWKKFYKNGVTDIIIPNEEIKEYFKSEFINK